ncbi:MAG: hypothetical protein Q9168_003970 [Polycauliona sp. 1 TL-2023]
MSYLADNGNAVTDSWKGFISSLKASQDKPNGLDLSSCRMIRNSHAALNGTSIENPSRPAATALLEDFADYLIRLSTAALQEKIKDRLTKDHGLRTAKKQKPVLYAEDEFELLKTLYMSPESTFENERYRIQLALIMQLAGITGNRPAALLGIQYRHIKVTLMPDPQGSELPRVLIEILFNHTKGYLGGKDSNEFGIPDVPNEPYQAFAAPDLSTPDMLFRLRIPPGQKQLLVPLKVEYAGRFLFRRCETTAEGRSMSETDALPYRCLRDQLLNLGNLTGMTFPVGPYTFRRGAGQAFDNGSHITDAQRNIILQHKSSSVFQKSYASRYMPDTQAAYRSLEPQSALMRAASGMSRTIDLRRPRDLSLAQRAEVELHPEVRRLSQELKSLRESLKRQKRSVTSSKGTTEDQRKTYK